MSEAFKEAASKLSAALKASSPDMIGDAHALSIYGPQLNARQVRYAIEEIGEHLRHVNNAYAALRGAHAAMTIGETASRLRAASEQSR